MHKKRGEFPSFFLLTQFIYKKVDLTKYENGFNVWMVLVMTLTSGVMIGFILALFQIISQKSEIFSYLPVA